MTDIIGFKFRNIHSSTFDIWVRSDDRSLIPEMRKNEFVIPGRDGTIDFGMNTYEKRQIKVRMASAKNKSWEELRAHTREIARWLSGKGTLIFDDEPDKAYQAAVYESVGIEQVELLPVGAFIVTFEAQPFAEDIYYNQLIENNITTKPYSIPVNVKGTTDSCCIITIKNSGTTTINTITLTRKAEI